MLAGAAPTACRRRTGRCAGWRSRESAIRRRRGWSRSCPRRSSTTWRRAIPTLAPAPRPIRGAPRPGRACPTGAGRAGSGTAASKLLGRESAVPRAWGTRRRRAPAVTVAALAVANPFGDVLGADGEPLALARADGATRTADAIAAMEEPPDPFKVQPGNTTLACVMTDAPLDKSGCARVARGRRRHRPGGRAGVHGRGRRRGFAWPRDRPGRPTGSRSSKCRRSPPGWWRGRSATPLRPPRRGRFDQPCPVRSRLKPWCCVRSAMGRRTGCCTCTRPRAAGSGRSRRGRASRARARGTAGAVLPVGPDAARGGGDLATVTGAHTVAAHLHLRASGPALAAAARGRRGAAPVDSAEANPAAYNLLCRYLALLDGEDSGEERDVDGAAGLATALAFRLKLALSAGFAPELAGCARCGESGELHAFSGAAGGVVAGVPARRVRDLGRGAPVHAGRAGTAVGAGSAATPRALRQASGRSRRTLEHHAHVQLRAAA